MLIKREKRYRKNLAAKRKKENAWREKWNDRHF